MLQTRVQIQLKEIIYSINEWNFLFCQVLKRWSLALMHIYHKTLVSFIPHLQPSFLYCLLIGVIRLRLSQERIKNHLYMLRLHVHMCTHNWQKNTCTCYMTLSSVPEIIDPKNVSSQRKSQLVEVATQIFRVWTDFVKIGQWLPANASGNTRASPKKQINQHFCIESCLIRVVISWFCAPIVCKYTCMMHVHADWKICYWTCTCERLFLGVLYEWYVSLYK